jgi:hypothetical protein
VPAEHAVGSVRMQRLVTRLWGVVAIAMTFTVVGRPRSRVWRRSIAIRVSSLPVRPGAPGASARMQPRGAAHPTGTVADDQPEFDRRPVPP